MSNTAKQLLNLLKTIEGSGSFAVSGVHSFTLPGLHLNGLGEIGFPIQQVQAEEIIRLAQKAPFGKGSRTITDTNVRSAWEVDADQLSFHNEDWEKLMEEIMTEVKEGFGIEEHSVRASLYKLLLYEKGDFFLSHKDSEKEEGMFATLVVGLPSTHTGGELIIRFDGREEIVDFSSAASNYKIPYAAFYADCEHEIKPLASGYRVCLVYNLLQSEKGAGISSPQFNPQVDQMAELLKKMERSFKDGPKAVLLEHQYTPVNFCLAHLKQHDRPRAEALLSAAEKAGYFASLGLVTHYLMGELEGGDHYYYGHSRRGRYYQEPDPEEETMGEVYEEYSTITYWSEDGAPSLGEINISPEDIWTNLDSLVEEEPLEKEAEGYTGNAGMTIEYWYHYGAIILWPQKQHFDLLTEAPAEVRLKWLGYYLQHWEEDRLHPRDYTRQLITALAKESREKERYQRLDFSPLAMALAKLDDEGFLRERGLALLVAEFANIKAESWIRLLRQYDPEIFKVLFQKVANKGDVFVTRRLLEILIRANDKPEFHSFVMDQIRQLPDYLRKVELDRLEEAEYLWQTEKNEARREAVRAIVENVLAISACNETDIDWVRKTLEQLTRSTPRQYVNEVLTTILLTREFEDRALTEALYKFCINDLTARAAAEPTPPSDWKRAAPADPGHYPQIWEILRPFLQSPTQRVFDYVRNESERKVMESVLNHANVDLDMQTIRKGRPYTLRLTKNMASFQRAYSNWKEDVALLKRLSGIHI